MLWIIIDLICTICWFLMDVYVKHHTSKELFLIAILLIAFDGCLTAELSGVLNFNPVLRLSDGLLAVILIIITIVIDDFVIPHINKKQHA